MLTKDLQDQVMAVFTSRYKPDQPSSAGFWLAYAYKKAFPSGINHDDLANLAEGIAGYYGLDSETVYSIALTKYDVIGSKDAIETACARAVAEPASPPYPRAGVIACRIMAVCNDLARHQTEFVLPQTILAERLGSSQPVISAIINTLIHAGVLVCIKDGWSYKNRIAKVYKLDKPVAPESDCPF